MSGARYVVLGLAPARATWLSRLSTWAADGTLPVEVVRCLSAEEVRAHLTGGRRVSAVIVGGAHPGCDRDLAHTVRLCGAAFLVVATGAGPGRSFSDRTLVEGFGPAALLDALATVSSPIDRVERIEPAPPVALPLLAGSVSVVCGTGGTGASTLASALAQGLAVDDPGRVVLADLRTHPAQAALHDRRDVVCTVQELTEAHRTTYPDPADVRASTLEVEARRYRLLPGIRRPGLWPALRARAFESAFASLRTGFVSVVAEIDGDLAATTAAGPAPASGSDGRHLMALTALAGADSVFVVGRPGLSGIHALTGLVDAVAGCGVDPARVVPVVNRAPRRPRVRAEMARALSGLTRAGCSPVLFLPEVPAEQAWLDGAAWPDRLAGRLAGAHRAVVGRIDRSYPADVEHAGPEPVTPGSLGHWTEMAG